jgi:uncharacterized membrane protein
MNDNKKKTIVSSTTTTYSCYSFTAYAPAQRPAPMRVLTKEEIEAKNKKQTEKSKMQIVGEKIVQALKAFLIFYIKLAIFILLVRVVKYVLRER